MNVLLIGYSSIARRRVLPALAAIDDVHRIDIASISAGEGAVSSVKKLGQVFRSYDEALRRSSAAVVYLSLHNSAHAYWSEQALRLGKHVIVDKPACTESVALNRVIALASEANRCFAEALVYPFHPQFQAIRRVFADAGDAPKRIIASFMFPPLEADNFRYVPELGGGALLDLGPYAASLGRIFYGGLPEHASAHITGTASSHRESKVEASFAALLQYSGERSVLGQFGCDATYLNRLTVAGDRTVVTSDRAFTTPSDFTVDLSVRSNGREDTVVVEAADSFQIFLTRVLKAIEANDWAFFTDAILHDASVLEDFRKAVGGAA